MAKKRPRGQKSRCKQIGGTFVLTNTYALAAELAGEYSIGMGFDRMAKLARAAIRRKRKVTTISSVTAD